MPLTETTTTDGTTIDPDAVGSAGLGGTGLSNQVNAINAAIQGRNKLLPRESIYVLMLLSLFFGILFLVYNFLLQRQMKDAGHFYLPRPKTRP